MGVLHFKTGKRNQAEKDFKKGLDLAQKTVPDSGPHLAPILANLASLYYSQQKWSLAESSMLQSLHVAETVAWAGTSGCLCVAEQSGSSLLPCKADWPRLKPCIDGRWILRRKAFGTENPYTAMSAANLAEVLAAEGENDEAGILFAEALKTQERTLGSEVPEVASTLEKFARLLRHTNNNVLRWRNGGSSQLHSHRAGIHRIGERNNGSLNHGTLR